MLAFVGEANDGLPDRGCVPSLRTGMRLGVVGASPGTDVVGDVLRRFEGDESIVEVYGGFMSFHVLGGNLRVEWLLWKPQYWDRSRSWIYGVVAY